MRYAALVLLAAFAVGCTSAQPPAAEPTPLAKPDPCDLVAAKTVDELVGPSLPARGADSCAWRLQSDTAAALDNKVRPYRRELVLRTSDECPTTAPNGERQVCLDGGAAALRFEGADWQDGKAVDFAPARVNQALDRFERDIKARWTKARRVPPTTLPDATAQPAAVDACTLVSAATLKAIGIDQPADPTAGSYACQWKTRQGYPQVRVLASPQVDRDGQRAADWATMAVRQFAYGWGAPAVDDIGDKAAIVSSQGYGQVWVADGPVLVIIEITATHAPKGAVFDWIVRSAKDAVSALS